MTIDDFKGVALLPESKSRSLHLMQLRAKHRQVSITLWSLPSVLKDKRSCFCQSVQLPLVHVCSSEVGQLIDICKSSISIFLVLTKQANDISFTACINVHRT